jgi:hypothetical protein
MYPDSGFSLLISKKKGGERMKAQLALYLRNN